MAPTNKNKSKHQPAKDFAKRPRAKVGKRAPAKLNATDTSFKTSSVAVRSQAISLDKNAAKTQGGVRSSLASRMEMQSSRGNALSTLQTSLRHHAAAVRCSGLKGIRDAVQSLAGKEDGTKSKDDDDVEVLNLGISVLEANLPSLLPNMCRCWLDEDGDVRKLAIHLFGDIINDLSVQSRITNIGGAAISHLMCLVPFVPILCAYASSALNSLDRSIRKDGSLIVGMMASCTANPSFSLLREDCENEEGSAAMTAEVGKHVDLFLPSLERLLSSMTFGGRTKAKSTSGGGKNEKKRKREAKSTSTAPESTSSSIANLGAADATLLSLALLLKASLSDNMNLDSLDGHESMTCDTLPPTLRVARECTFLQGGSAYANSMLFLRGVQRQHISSEVPSNPISKTCDLPFMPDYDNARASNNLCDEDESLVDRSFTPKADITVEKAQILTTLVETLRIKLVELTQSGRSSTTDQKGVILQVSDLDTLAVLLKTLMFANRRARFFCDLKDSRHLQKESKNMPKKRQKKSLSTKSALDTQDLDACRAAYRSSISKALSLMLDNFPICSFEGKVSTSRNDLINVELCSSMADLGGETLGSVEAPSCWVDPVFSYILPRLSQNEETLASFELEGGDASAFIDALLKITRKLLLPTCIGRSGFEYLLKSNSKRQELLQVFADTFFPYRLVLGSNGCIDSLTQNGQGLWLKKFACTVAGRTAASLLASLISCIGGDVTRLAMQVDQRTYMLILQMASVLPVYLFSWQHDFPLETGKVLSSMVSIIKRRSASSDGSNSSFSVSKLCTEYRSSLSIMFRSTSSVQQQSKGQSMTSSTFEMSPEPIQKLTMGLVYLLGCPNENVVTMISKICSRALCPNKTPQETSISSSMVLYIFEVMHLMRKTMKMSAYLSFLINASGIEKACIPQIDNGYVVKDATEGDRAAMFSYDISTQILSRFLIGSHNEAPSKILPMIRPTLEKWLLPQSSSNSNNTKQIIQARAAMSIVATFTWEEVYPHIILRHGTTNFTQSEFLKLGESFDQLLLESMLNMFELLVGIGATSSVHSENEIQQQLVARLLGPVTLILCFRDEMLSHFLHELRTRILKLSRTERSSDSRSWTTIEIHMRTLLLLLTSKEPAAISTLIKQKATLQDLLLSVVEQIEKAVSTSHLMSLSEKLSHEAKHIIRLCKPKQSAS
eukprot:CCRYP_014109-RA/>CCRYP_014109-RA protein AED:0.27 eAED:0.27 QI:0/-1/0/1/-1/1/1/0/1182